MNSLRLDEFGKDTTVHAQADEYGENGFEDQPEYGRNYDPRDDKRGTRQWSDLWMACNVTDANAWLWQICTGLGGSKN